MSSSTVSALVSEKLKCIIDSFDDWVDDDRSVVLNEYMGIFDQVWARTVELSEKPHPESQLIEDDEKDDDDGAEKENLEDVEILHEATLIAVTKKRKSYPHTLAGLTGKTTRLCSKSIETQKVDLPPHVPLEVCTGVDNLEKNCSQLTEDNLASLTSSMLTLQPRTTKLQHLEEAIQIIVNNRE
ncbi:uncharacterized protein LOC143029299 [Oratosquilla oratoria]|uniref:uncharacterized protein LOC143029299 n=1 Tax=Oratosquilla oratoria TaxID=337810 RepID=UPI003F75EB98